MDKSIYSNNAECIDINSSCRETSISNASDCERPCSILESLKQSLIEMQKMRRGEIPTKSWEELKKELESEK